MSLSELPKAISDNLREKEMIPYSDPPVEPEDDKRGVGG
jgi:hypothetical protein